MREPPDRELQAIVQKIKDTMNLDAIDYLRVFMRELHDEAIADAVIVMLGSGIDSGFNPHHLSVMARRVRELKWGVI